MDAAAADADGDARSGRQARGELGFGELALNLGRDIADGAIGEVLADCQEAGKFDAYSIAENSGSRSTPRSAHRVDLP